MIDCVYFSCTLIIGMYLAMLAISWPFAATLTALFAYAIIPHVETLYIASLAIQSWRLFLIPCSIPAFAASVVFLRFVDHSPKWLIYTKHNYHEASRVLIKVFRINNDGNMTGFQADLFDPSTLRSWAQRDMEVDSILLARGADSVDPNADSNGHSVSVVAAISSNGHSSPHSSSSDHFERGMESVQSEKSLNSNLLQPTGSALSWDGFRRVWIKTTLLFSPEHRRSHVLAGLVWFSLSFGFYGLAEWLPTYFGSKSDINEYLSSIATSAAQFPGAILTCWFLEFCCDRKITLSVSIGLGALTIIGIPYLQNGTEIVILTCVFNGVTVCAWGALDVLSTELSPTNIRSTAFGFFGAMGRVGAIMGNLTFGAFGQDDIAPALTVCGIVMAVGTASCLMLPSTKGVAIK